MYIHGLIILLHIDIDDNFIDNDDNIIIDERLNDLDQNSSQLIEGICTNWFNLKVYVLIDSIWN